MTVALFGDNSTDDYSGTEDAQIRGSAATYNYGALNYFGMATDRYALMKFSGFSSVSGPISASTATLYQYINGSAAANQTIEIRRVLRNWIEGTQVGADRSNDTPYSCCWSEYGDANSFTSAGCQGDGTDRVTSSSATISITASDTGYVSSGNLASDFADMVNGTVNNYGWLEQFDGTTVYYYTSEIGDGQRPYVYTDYTSSSGVSETDSGSGNDVVFVKSLLKESDSGTGNDVLNNLKAILGLDDSGAGSDTDNESSSIFDSDSIVSTEDIKILVSTSLSDSGAGSDNELANTGSSKQISDTGIFVDYVFIKSILTVLETSSGSDTETEKTYIDLDDSFSGNDAINAKANLTISENGVYVDSIGIKAYLQLLDSGITADDITAESPTKILEDYGIFIDSISVVAGGFVEQIYFKSSITKELNFNSVITDTLNFKSVLQ